MINAIFKLCISLLVGLATLVVGFWLLIYGALWIPTLLHSVFGG